MMGQKLPKALVVALLAVMGLELAHQFTGLPWIAGAAYLAMAAVILCAAPLCGLREAYLITLSAVLAGLIWWVLPDPSFQIARSLDQAVFLMAFLLIISLMQEAAMSSGSVAKLGLYLAQQPGGRRFFGLFNGTMVMGVVFNIGTLSLLAPLIRRAAEQATDDPLTPVRERRQLNAVLRGFAWSVVWSPTAIAPLALIGLLPGIDRLQWIWMGLVLSLIMLLLGWLEDRISWRHHTAAAYGQTPVIPPPLPVQAMRRFLGVCGALALITGVLMAVSGLGVPGALMGAAPVIMLIWLLVQKVDLPPRLTQIAVQGLPASAPAAVTLACSGFVGIAAAALLPTEDVAEWIGLDETPAWLFLLGTTLSVTALSQLALSPIMMSVFFGAVLAKLPSLPADVTLTALAVATGWAVATTCSPFASGVIFLARVTGHPETRLTYGWNLKFTALSIGVLAVAYWVMTGGA